jgi:hypothetical protein
LEAIKEYPYSGGMLLQLINDLVELQNAKLTFSDTPNGKIHFLVKMYYHKWEHCFTVTETGKNTCNVKLEINQDNKFCENQIRREFALMDSMLNEDKQIEIKKGSASLAG